MQAVVSEFCLHWVLNYRSLLLDREINQIKIILALSSYRVKIHCQWWWLSNLKVALFNSIFMLLIIFCWLCFFLISRCHPNRWVAVVSWLSYLILAVDQCGSFTQHLVKCTSDLFLDSSALLHIHHAASHSFHCNTFVMAHMIFSSLRDCYPVKRQTHKWCSLMNSHAWT